MSALQVRSHQVARAAYSRVDARKAGPSTREYGALAHKLPALILQHGLAHASGFLLAKGEKHHHALLDDLAVILRDTGTQNCADGKALHQAAIKADLAQTMQLTRRALEASGWLKRYVQGVLKVDATGAEVNHG